MASDGRIEVPKELEDWPGLEIMSRATERLC